MHLEGKPQGPSLSFPSTAVVGSFVFAAGVGVFPFFADSVAAGGSPSFTSPFEPPGSQKLTLLTTVPNVSPVLCEYFYDTSREIMIVELMRSHHVP